MDDFLVDGVNPSMSAGMIARRTPPVAALASTGGSSVLDASFAERVAVLMRSRPIADGLNHAGHQSWPENLYDTATFSLAAIDLVISRQGFDNEVTLEEAIRHLAGLAFAAAPNRPHEEHTKVAIYTLDLLINRSCHGVKFSYQISDYTARGHLRRVVEFWLLQLKEDPVLGVTVLNATSDAINALVNGLAFDVTDEQVANEAMLERQLARGAFAAAERAASQHRGLSLKFTEEIQGIIKETQRDLRSVLDKWVKEVPERLDQARQHIQERLEMEHRLVAKARDSLEADDPDTRAAAARIAAILEECRHRHQILHQKVMAARTVFLNEQDRQAFRPPSLGLSVDLAEDVFEPSWSLPVALAQPLAENWLVHVSGPRTHRIPDLGRLINDLFGNRRSAETVDEAEEPEELGSPDPPTISPHVRDAATLVAAEIGLPVRISTLIAACLAAKKVLPEPDDRHQAAQLVVLAALWCFAPETADDDNDQSGAPQASIELAAALFGERAVSDTDGTVLQIPGWTGDDLVVASHADQFAEGPLPLPTLSLPESDTFPYPAIHTRGADDVYRR